MRKLFVCALISAKSFCKIVAEGPWTGHDYTVQDRYTIESGNVSWLDEELARRVNSAHMVPTVTQYQQDSKDKTSLLTREIFLEGDVNLFERDNIKLIKSIMTEKDWDEIFPQRKDGYDFDKLLTAVARFPSFCAEFG